MLCPACDSKKKYCTIIHIAKVKIIRIIEESGELILSGNVFWYETRSQLCRIFFLEKSESTALTLMIRGINISNISLND